MKTSKLILAAMLLSVLSLATFNGTNAQTNSSINQQVKGPVTNSPGGQSEIHGFPYLAAANVDDNAHNNTKKAKTLYVTLSYTDNLPVGVGHLLYVEFKTGSTTYTFQNYQIDGATIPQGNYSMTLYISNPLGYTTYSTDCEADCWWGCSPYTSGTYLTPTLSANLSTCTTLAIYSNPYHCPNGGD